MSEAVRSEGEIRAAAEKWRLKAHKVAEEVVRPLAKKYDELQEYPWEIKEAIAEAGLFGVWIPEEYGGHGAGVLALCQCVEELSRACPGVGVMYAVNALGSFPIILGGNEEQKQRWLPEIAKGNKLCAFGLSEKFAGSDAGGLATRAVQDGDDWILNGEKKWTTNGTAANLITMFCVTDPESRSRRISAIVVENDMEGFSIGKVEDKMGIRCAPVVETVMKDVRVPHANLLGGRAGLGFKHAMMTLDHARPGVAAQAVGCAQGALELALVYTSRRKQFGQSVSSFQMVQKLLSDMGMKTEAARALVYTAAMKLDQKDGNFTKYAAMAKCYATDVAMEVTTDAVQLFGGYGFMKDYPIEKYMRDAKITQIYEGTNQVQRLVIARNMIKEIGQFDYLDEFIPKEVQIGVNDEEPVTA